MIKVCTDRNYAAGAYLSPTQKCPDCPYEVYDLFHGLKGRFFFGYYCEMPPEIMLQEQQTVVVINQGDPKCPVPSS